MKLLAWVAAFAGMSGCTPTPASAPPKPAPSAVVGQDDLESLSDEFGDSDSLKGWRQVFETEGWGADQLEKLEVQEGQLVLMPYASTWYQDYRGVLVYKDVVGDFVVTTNIAATGRDGRSAPQAQFSLGGIMVRTPRTDNAESWRPGGENYIFQSLGSADQIGKFQFEVKTTAQSQSDLQTSAADSGDAFLQVVKIGPELVLLRKQGASWIVGRRYHRPDMSSTLQVGLTVYSDYPTASRQGPKEHNGMVIRDGHPDLIAKFDFVRFRRPKVPAGFDAARASDGELIQMFGESAL